MRDYGADSYGEAFADVYDDWYATVTDVDATVSAISDVAGPGGRVVELGVGTGRLALPLARAGLSVTGIDTSASMLAKLAEADIDGVVRVVHGDMATDIPEGPFDVALAAYNTIFNLLDEAVQRACFASVAARLTPGGSFVVEAFVPDHAVEAGSSVSVRSMGIDHVVLSVSEHRPDEQRASGQFVELTEAGGVRLRPWAIRWASPTELDDMARAAGFVVAERWSDMTRAPFDDDSTHHVTVYRST